MHTLPKLPYAYNALEPHIDEATMKLHHLKHHQTYIDKLNAALEPYPEFVDWSLEKLIRNLRELPENIKADAANHGGGHYNHSFFWQILQPVGTGGENFPNQILMNLLVRDFGSYEKFKDSFKHTALARFGSGWAWLTVDEQGKLGIASSPNQDNPIMLNTVPNNPRPILGLDVWEHAYYLKYQNRRADYINSFFNIINWGQVEKLLTDKK
ncbi:MAG: superoxide dismutase [Patescibacteria group bacterium]